jgi:mannosyltransferase OCH1-like enzyme
MITKIIHQMWLDKHIETNSEHPAKYSNHVNSIKHFNSDFKYIFWNKNMVKQLLEDHLFVKYKSFWYNLPVLLQQCDFARYLILFKYGGIYIDLDFKCFKNLFPLINNRNLLLTWESNYHSNPSVDRVPNRLLNGVIGSKPNNPIWLDFVDFIILHYNDKRNPYTHQKTGPAAFARFMLSNNKYYTQTNFVDKCLIIPYYSAPKKKHNEYIIKKIPECKHTSSYLETYWGETSAPNSNKIIFE